MPRDFAHLIPRYHTIADDLREAIRDGTYAEGDRVPGEFDLARRYEVSRGTVRQALGLLYQEGLLVRKRGLGTYVSNSKIEQNFLQLMGFTEVMHAHKLRAHAKLLEVDIVLPPRRIAKLLQLGREEKVVSIERLRYGDDEPLIVERSYFVQSLFAPLLDCDLEESSIYELLASRTRVRLGRARQSIEAKVCGPMDADRLNVPLGSPMLLMKRLVFTDSEQVFEYSEDTYRGDRLTFTITTSPYAARENWQLNTLPELHESREKR